MDEIVKKIAGLGLPGVLIVIAMAASGGVGGSYAIIAALVGLGGPFGLVGGIGVLSLMTLVGEALAGYGIETILKSIYAERSKTESVGFLLKQIKDLPITEELKIKLKSVLGPEEISSDSKEAQSPKTIEITDE